MEFLWKKKWLCVVLFSCLLMQASFTSGCATPRRTSPRMTEEERTDAPLVAGCPDTDNPEAAPAHRGLGHRLLWYIPNRLLDLTDVFRFRFRAGPGLAAHVRVTDYANIFVGRYNTVYLGLPGPRMSPTLRSPVGLERKRGLMLMGVDATDDLPHEPDYSPTEFNAGAQLLIVGLEVGFDPIELADFLSGFVLIDLREDDR